jgi:hypothetical protein
MQVMEFIFQLGMLVVDWSEVMIGSSTYEKGNQIQATRGCDMFFLRKPNCDISTVGLRSLRHPTLTLSHCLDYH